MSKKYQDKSLTILLANPRGFCAGVDRAILIVEKALEKYGAPVYVRHEIVHNKHVLDDLRAKGAVFVETLDDVPENVPVIFSAHGVPKRVPEAAQKRGMFFIDATCPLVSKVHRETERHHKDGLHVLLIGHAGHPEVIGTMGQLPDGAVTLIETAADAENFNSTTPEKLAYATQTTLSVDDTQGIVDILLRRFPAIAAPKKEDICYATTNRQNAVKAIAPRCDMLVVIGSANSSNANRLVETAQKHGCENAYLAQNSDAVDWDGIAEHVDTLGLSAGASTPEKLIQGVIDTAESLFGGINIEHATVAEENITFKLPRDVAA
ncbi:MAG: 4-hydroxy-3-methylbut-2-enyl diphosphate reductase [Pseudomonadota bacterium]|nr:4-hydroxy-3-methylbut-2-enyl diphosphate reductase [Pseudomonadota bacterium]QKK04436.1 MAG: 4-hydroxy-3-methylbut-2-enyl diphosphate reductase [Pseudomonadota bacterium]